MNRLSSTWLLGTLLCVCLHRSYGLAFITPSNRGLWYKFELSEGSGSLSAAYTPRRNHGHPPWLGGCARRSRHPKRQRAFGGSAVVKMELSADDGGGVRDGLARQEFTTLLAEGNVKVGWTVICHRNRSCVSGLPLVLSRRRFPFVEYLHQRALSVLMEGSGRRQDGEGNLCLFMYPEPEGIAPDSQVALRDQVRKGIMMLLRMGDGLSVRLVEAACRGTEAGSSVSLALQMQQRAAPAVQE